MFETVRYEKGAGVIVDQVRRAVLDGKLRAGDRLPPVRQLTQEFGVSRTTPREAVRVLEALGFLEIRKGAGGGPFVVEVDMRTARNALRNFLHFKHLSLEDLTEVRLILEPYLAEKATNQISKRRTQRLGRKCLEDRARGGSIGTFSYEYEIEFHRTLASVAGNPILLLMINFIEDLLKDVKGILKPGEDFSRRVVESHKRIYQIILRGDSIAAAAEMSRHVRDVGSDLIAVRKRSEEGKNTGDVPYRQFELL